MMQRQQASATSSSFPARAFIQGANFLPEVKAELERRNVPVIVLQTEQDGYDWEPSLINELKRYALNSSDLVVAWPSWVETALGEVLGVDALRFQPPDYPESLRHLLRRKVWRSTLGEIRDGLAQDKIEKVFIKPAGSAKTFSGFVANGVEEAVSTIDMFLEFQPGLTRATEVYCGDIVDMRAGEYAVYVVNGEICTVCHYMCRPSQCLCKDGEKCQLGADPIGLDMAVVRDAIATLKKENPDLSAGYRADFALTPSGTGENRLFETTLVEVNDGFFAGRYDGLSPEDYTDMIVARFKALQR